MSYYDAFEEAFDRKEWTRCLKIAQTFDFDWSLPVRDSKGSEEKVRCWLHFITANESISVQLLQYACRMANVKIFTLVSPIYHGHTVGHGYGSCNALDAIFSSKCIQKYVFPILWERAGLDLENIDFNYTCHSCKTNNMLFNRSGNIIQNNKFYAEKLKAATEYKKQLKTLCGSTIFNYLGISGICNLIQSYCYL